MTIEEFKLTLADEEPPPLPAPLRALWFDGRGDWDAAHEAVQGEGGLEAAWVHAYLHRKEGDHGNARYWYGRAERAYPDETLDQEWQSIANALFLSELRNE